MIEEIRSAVDYKTAWSLLQRLPGVGPKVSDCICLMGLAQWDAVPLDVHVLRMSAQLFPTSVVSKSLTRRRYEEIGARWRDTFAPHTGWAHLIFFTSDLDRFKKPVKKSKSKEAS